MMNEEGARTWRKAESGGYKWQGGLGRRWVMDEVAVGDYEKRLGLGRMCKCRLNIVSRTICMGHGHFFAS
jgi:hypothetical protein